MYAVIKILGLLMISATSTEAEVTAFTSTPIIAMSATSESDFRLPIHEKVFIDDSLTIMLTSFSHKRPFKNGPTKATAYLTLFMGTYSEEITLSVHGVDGTSGVDSYDSVQWKNYTFQLKKFEYDQSVVVQISRL